MQARNANLKHSIMNDDLRFGSKVISPSQETICFPEREGQRITILDAYDHVWIS